MIDNIVRDEAKSIFLRLEANPALSNIQTRYSELIMSLLKTKQPGTVS
jgi:hypothetical protein